MDNLTFTARRVWARTPGPHRIWLMLATLLTLMLPLPTAAQGTTPGAQAGIPAAYQPLGENERFALYANPETIAFKVVDKRNGYVWHSNLDERGENDRLNRTWTAFASSGISIDYLDEKAQDRRLSITTAKHAVDFKPVEGGFEAAVLFEDPGITVLVRVVLEPEGVRVEAPFAGIKQENPAFKLGTLHLYPWLGAVRTQDVPGYMYIPNGSGSLIRFSEETKAKNMLYGRYYGADLGMIGTRPYEPSTKWPFNMSLPVIGMAHGIAAAGAELTPVAQRNAFISVIEQGAGYGEIQMHPAGVTTNFNFIYNAFIYNESYFQATNKAGAGVTALQRETNVFDVVIHHRFLAGSDADYVGMARSYQQYLVARGILKPAPALTAAPNADISVRLEFLAGEAEKVVFFNRPIPMTTVEQMASIVSGLKVANPQVVYYGWWPGGASAQPPRSLKLDGSLGTLDQLRALGEKLTAEGGRLYLYLDPQAAIVGQGGYSARRDLAMFIGDQPLLGFNREKVNHLFNLPALRERFLPVSAGAAERAAAELAIDGLGWMVYSDFQPGSRLNREQAITNYQKLLSESGRMAGFYQPNDYVFGFMDAYLDVPLTDSGFIYVDETVPFLQIVLAGYVPYYGAALNFSSNLQGDLLRMADYGVYPSFFLTHEPTSDILNTASNWIYTSQYEQWAPEVERNYEWLNGLLAPVRGQPIVARERLPNNVTATSYANGKRVIVNYGDNAVTIDGTTIAGRDAALVEVQR